MEKCPECGSTDLHDRWKAGRKLQRGCNDCDWEEAPRTPEILPIKNTKRISANHFSGFCFEVFDKYGHTLLISKSYDSKDKAKEDAVHYMKKWNQSPECGPCTSVVWPNTVEVTGEIIKL